MGFMKWCRFCKDYYPTSSYGDHMNQHKHEMNIDEQNNKQYVGNPKSKNEDYMVCVLHQKKCPCPVKGCNLRAFGCIKKSRMIQFMKNGIWKGSDCYGNAMDIPIDVSTRTVVLKGVPILLRV